MLEAVLGWGALIFGALLIGYITYDFFFSTWDRK